MLAMEAANAGEGEIRHAAQTARWEHSKRGEVRQKAASSKFQKTNRHPHSSLNYPHFDRKSSFIAEPAAIAPALGGKPGGGMARKSRVGQ
jgi:hypothetical protein